MLALIFINIDILLHPPLTLFFLSLLPPLLTGTNRISHAVQGAHEGSIFALCMMRNGTLVSGGKDRKLISWDGAYQQIQTVEVRLWAS